MTNMRYDLMWLSPNFYLSANINGGDYWPKLNMKLDTWLKYCPFWHPPISSHILSKSFDTGLPYLEWIRSMLVRFPDPFSSQSGNLTRSMRTKEPICAELYVRLTFSQTSKCDVIQKFRIYIFFHISPYLNVDDTINCVHLKLFLSDPGVPGVRSMGPVVCP